MGRGWWMGIATVWFSDWWGIGSLATWTVSACQGHFCGNLCNFLLICYWGILYIFFVLIAYNKLLCLNKLQEKVLEIEYTRAVVLQKEDEPSLHDDWVSAVDGSCPR